jgi:acetoin utilization protein AcuB
MRRFVHCNDGSSVIEYALILALIAGSLVFGLEAVQFFHGTEQLTAHLSGNRSIAQPTDAPHRPVVGIEQWKERIGQLDQILGLRIVVLGLLVTTVTMALLVLRGRRKHEKEAFFDEAPVDDSKQSQARFVAKRQEILRTLSKDVRFLMESHVDVQKVMSNHVLTVSASASYEDIATLMRENHVRHLLVASPRGELLGVISDRDVARRNCGTAQTIMTANPACVALFTPIRNAISMMLDRHISCLPVVDEGRAVGILTTTDLTMMLQCALQLLDQLDLTVKNPPAKTEASGEVDEKLLVGAAI